MRHGKKNNHLGRTAPHRKAMLSNMASSLILHKRIITTVAKAKALRKFVEPLLTKSKDDNTHNRRTVFAYLQNKEVIKTLFDEVSEKIANRNGGYTRIIKLGQRHGDAAETAMIELVDYNEILLAASTDAPAKAKRTRRAGSKKASDSEQIVATTKEESTPIVEDAVVVNEVNETPEVAAAAPEETSSSDGEESSSEEDTPKEA